MLNTFSYICYNITVMLQMCLNTHNVANLIKYLYNISHKMPLVYSHFRYMVLISLSPVVICYNFVTDKCLYAAFRSQHLKDVSPYNYFVTP